MWRLFPLVSRNCRRSLCTPAAASADKEALTFLAARGRGLGLDLSLAERKLIAAEADRHGDGDGRMSPSDWRQFVSTQQLASMERLTLSEYLIKAHDVHLGQHLLKGTAQLGVSFFALTASQIAGESGMHVVGSTLVGCITALGGGTINNVMVGSTPVGWMKDPSYLASAIAASLLGFYLMPLAERMLESRDATATLLESRDDATAATPAQGMPSVLESRDATPARLKLEGANAQGMLDTTGTYAPLANREPSVLRYSLESVALGALAVIGAQQGIVRGLHPLVSSSLGVTVTLGGVLRDLMCGRELSLGARSGCQSYAIASFSAASVYVGLRQLHVWNCAGSCSRLVHGGIPIGIRILVSASAAIGIRAWAWQQKPDGIFSSMETCADANHARIRAWVATDE